MSALDDLKNGIDTAINDNKPVDSITPNAVATQLKNVADYAASNPGPAGADGAPGLDGLGVPPGGSAGQILAKISNTDNDTHWINQLPGGGGGSGQNLFDVMDFGAVHDGVTDDTEAIQAAINAANNAGGGVVYLPNGIYLIAGSLDESGNQISFPARDYAASTTHNHIKLLGEVAPNYYSDPFNGGLPPNTGVILLSTLLTAGNVIGAHSNVGLWGDTTYCHMDIENITVRVRSKTGSTDVAPEATAINAFNVAYLSALNVRVDTESDQKFAVMPAETCKGIVFPAVNNYVMVNADKVFITGFYTGVELYEHASLDNIFIDMCYQAVKFGFAYHAALINKICVARCRSVIVAGTSVNFSINSLAIEVNVGSHWWSSVYDLEETGIGGQCSGYIRYNRVIAGGGEIVNDVFIRSNQSPSAIFAEPINSYSSKLLIPNPQIDTYTLTKLDAFKIVTINKATSTSLFIPANSSIPLAPGTEIKIAQVGDGVINVTANNGVTILSLDDKFTTEGKGAVATLTKLSLNLWLLTGSVIATGNGGNPGNGSDPDAQTFITASGITSQTEKDAVTNLIVAFKAGLIWDKIRVFYPFVGSGEVPCSYNLKNPAAFRLTFFGAKVFDSFGYRPDGSTSYANTGFNPMVQMPGLGGSTHSAYYSLDATPNGGSFMGAYNGDAPITQFQLRYNGGVNYTSVNSARAGSSVHPAALDFSGLWLANRNSLISETIDRNGALFSTAAYNATTNGLPNASLFIGANNESIAGSPTGFTASGGGCASYGEGFTNTEKALFADAVSAFLNALGR